MTLRGHSGAAYRPVGSAVHPFRLAKGAHRPVDNAAAGPDSHAVPVLSKVRRRDPYQRSPVADRRREVISNCRPSAPAAAPGHFRTGG
jgi:hypothetical protein